MASASYIRLSWLTLALLAGSGTMAQNTHVGANSPSAPAPPGLTMPNTSMDESTLDPAMVHRRDETRKLERKKSMVNSANRLLALTQQLRADLQGREATPEDQKRLDEIARLARQVKDQMRN